MNRPTHRDRATRWNDLLTTPRALAALAVLLAALGVGLIGWAAGHQTGAPPGAADDVPAATGPAALPAPAAGPVRLVVRHGPAPLPWVLPGPAFGPGPGSVTVHVEPVPAPPAPGRRFRPPSPPVTLRVPAIRVDAPLTTVGLRPDRTMEVPAPGPAYDLPAWYRYSVTPGEQGPSVIVGHVDSQLEGPSVFYELGRMRRGEVVEVARADGSAVRFEVTDVRRFGKATFPTAEVYSATRDAELRLITCSGAFDGAAGSYVDNTVVYARALP